MTLRWVPGWNGLTEPEAVSYVAAVEAADGQELEFGVAKAINDFVLGCKNDGIWDAIKACCILAGARTTNGALVPLVGTAPTPNNFDLVGDTDYDRKTGLVGDGSTKYLNSNRNTNADPQNNYSVSVWISTAGTPLNSIQLYIGAQSTIQGTTSLGIASSQLFTRNRSLGFKLFGSSAQTGFLGHSRSESANYVTRSGQTNVTQQQSSQAPANSETSIFAEAGTALYRSNARLAFYSIGEALDLTALDTRVSDLITAIGAAIP